MSAPSRGFDITAAYRALSIYELRRAGRLFPGLRGTWVWRRAGRVVDSIVIESEEDRLTIDDWRSIQLERQPCNFGGQRPWFRCPDCASRVAILYRADDGDFRCRSCMRLNYKVQRESRTDRLLRRAEKIRAKLGWEPGIANDPEGKPPNMRWKTYHRLTTEHDRIANAVFGGWIRQFEHLRSPRA